MEIQYQIGRLTINNVRGTLVINEPELVLGELNVK